MLDSVVKTNKTYHPQTLLEECKHEAKYAKMENLINDGFDPSISNNETDNESDNDESHD